MKQTLANTRSRRCICGRSHVAATTPHEDTGMKKGVRLASRAQGAADTINPFPGSKSHNFRLIRRRASARERRHERWIEGSCTSTLQLQCGTAALHLPRWRRRLRQPQRPKNRASGRRFSTVDEDRTSHGGDGGKGTAVKVPKKKTDTETGRGERKESHVVAGSR